MRRGVKLRLGVSILVTAITAAGVLMPSAALAQANHGVVSSTQTITTQAAATMAYWTAERMRDATPMPMRLARLSQPPTKIQREGSTAGPMVIANSGRPGDIPQEQTIGEETQGTMEPLVEPLAGTFPFVYTRYRLFPETETNLLYRIFPYVLTGKLFFIMPGEGNFVCSGASVNAQNRSVVWTAGHCVFSPGESPEQPVGFHTNFLFVPGRIAGANPVGAWTVLQAFTLVGWTRGLLEYDHGALVMNRGGVANERIGDAIGFLGFIANDARQQHWHLHGYPAGPRDLGSTPPGPQFDGEHHEICAAAWAGDDQPTGTPGVDPPTIGVGCDQTGGSSGGPWVIDFSGFPGRTNLLNGNISYTYTGLELFSPYFTDGAINLRNAAQTVSVP